MYNLTDDQIKELIQCPKIIASAPRKSMAEDMGHYKNSMELESIDKEHFFEVFMRKNTRFEENFSIGLMYKAKEEPSAIILLRMNGPHGNHINNWPEDNPHYGCHIHHATADNIELGLRSEKYAYLTDKYTAYEDALIYFLEHCNILDADKYFDHAKQISLFANEGFL